MGTPTRPGAFGSELSIQGRTATTWTVIAPLVWTGTAGDIFTVPVGFVTDFATVPRCLHWLVSPYGAYTRAAVLHDWLLTELAAWQRLHDSRGPEAGFLPMPPADSRDADGIFRRVMQDLGVPWSKRWIMWAGVRAAACFNHDRSFGRHFQDDALRVTGCALLALPVALPGVTGVLISLGLEKAASAVRRLLP